MFVFLFLFLFFVLILPILPTIEPTNYKKSYSQISKKHDQTTINLINILTLWANFRITLRLLNILHKILLQSRNLRQ